MEIKRLVVGSMQTNCYLLFSEKEMAVIDPGGDSGLILQGIKKHSAKPKYIINTHYHFDHTLSNSDIKKATRAKILIHGAEKGFIEFKPDRFLHDGDQIKIGNLALQVVHTPGHTAGSVCLLAKKQDPRRSTDQNVPPNKAGFIFTGDTLFKDGWGRTDLPGGSDEAMEKSLEKLSRLIKPGMTVYPGHGEIYQPQWQK